MINKTDLRETLDLPLFDTTSATEIFQNQTLRPVLKLQNEIYLMLFKDYALRKISDFDTLKREQKITFIDQSLQKDNALRNTFIGITIGMLTSEEMKIYLSDVKSFNKRIISMLTERIKSQLELI
ncbi:glyoxalase [uncultured Chryseobacterium sp.]|uniref:glyoxalase n=1 Tax=uncultured Chryseobacterium sp. TaxID=259322 RepID=UPI0025FB82FB|nr:glyoxalase [uncultured Chryseobacterium sp.]